MIRLCALYSGIPVYIIRDPDPDTAAVRFDALMREAAALLQEGKGAAKQLQKKNPRRLKSIASDSRMWYNEGVKFCF